MDHVECYSINDIQASICDIQNCLYHIIKTPTENTLFAITQNKNVSNAHDDIVTSLNILKNSIVKLSANNTEFNELPKNTLSCFALRQKMIELKEKNDELKDKVFSIYTNQLEVLANKITQQLQTLRVTNLDDTPNMQRALAEYDKKIYQDNLRGKELLLNYKDNMKQLQSQEDSYNKAFNELKQIILEEKEVNNKIQYKRSELFNVKKYENIAPEYDEKRRKLESKRRIQEQLNTIIPIYELLFKLLTQNEQLSESSLVNCNNILINEECKVLIANAESRIKNLSLDDKRQYFYSEAQRLKCKQTELEFQIDYINDDLVIME